MKGPRLLLMEQRTPGKARMVSRLPKFGPRCVTAVSSQHNGMVRTQLALDGRESSRKSSVVAMKWTRECGGSALLLPNQAVSGEKRETHVFNSPGTQTSRKPPTPVTTGHKSASPVTGSSKPAPKSSRSMSSPKTSQITPSSTTPCSSFSKQTQSGGRSKDSLPQTSCGLKTPSTDKMVRSQSFTYFRQPPSASSSIPRSFSFSKAVELAKPLPNTQLCPLRAPGLKPPQCLSSSRLGLGSGRGFPGFSSAMTSVSGCPTPLSGLKKPSPPNNVLSKPSGLGYRVPCSFAAKRQHSLVLRNQDENLNRTLPPTLEPNCDILKLTIRAGAGNSTLSGFKALQGAQTPADNDLQVLSSSTPSVETGCFESPEAPTDLSDGMEEMSFSSGSSDRNENCEDLLEDLDYLVDQSHNGTPDNKCLTTPTQMHLHNFLHADWVGVTVFVYVDSLGSSSLELSPSSSSGGTYMWDEEISYAHSHHCNDESDINTTVSSPVRTVNIQESDLLEHRKTAEKHNGAKPHSQNRLKYLQGFNDRPAVQSDDQMVSLQDSSLRQLLQDVSSVKSQLLRLKLLLQVMRLRGDMMNLFKMEDGEISSKESTEVNSAALQVRKSMIQLHSVLVVPSVLSLWMSLEGMIVLRAELKSIKSILTYELVLSRWWSAVWIARETHHQ
ncbi:hypothetical protein NFI96_028013 [Prochilodus magdalenae]|nr:hypothetical protein NFI96_028013 [Prochilodus magdalenae]